MQKQPWHVPQRSLSMTVTFLSKSTPGRAACLPEGHPSVSRQYSSKRDTAQGSLSTLDCHFSVVEAGQEESGHSTASRHSPEAHECSRTEVTRLLGLPCIPEYDIFKGNPPQATPKYLLSANSSSLAELSIDAALPRCFPLLIYSSTAWLAHVGAVAAGALWAVTGAA